MKGRTLRINALVHSYDAPEMYNWLRDTWYDIQRTREPHAVGQRGCAGMVATHCDSIYKDHYLRRATPAAAYMTKATGHLHKIRITRLDINYAEPLLRRPRRIDCIDARLDPEQIIQP
jgi:hypothetical protein